MSKISSATCKSREDTRFSNLPAIAQSDQTYALGNGRSYTRLAGELLHPDHEPAEVLLDIKKNMGSMAFSAQYQQSPEPPSGKIIKRKYLQYYSKLPELEERDRIIVSWDIALSEKETADYSAGVAMLKRGEKYYVLDVVRGQFPFSQLKDKIMSMKQQYGRVSLVIEKYAISIGLIQSLEEQRINVVSVKPVQDKRAKSYPRLICSKAAPCCCRRMHRGWRTSLPSCFPSPAAMTIRSTRWSKVSPGAALNGNRLQGRADQSELPERLPFRVATVKARIARSSPVLPRRKSGHLR